MADKAITGRGKVSRPRELRNLRNEPIEKKVQRQQREETLYPFASLVEHSGDAIIGWTLDGQIAIWNRGAEKMFGYPAAEIKGGSFSMVIPPERVAEFRQSLQTVRSGKNAQRSDTVLLRKDGKRILVSQTASPIKNAAGKIIGMATTLRDVSEKREAEEALRRSEEKFRALASTVDAAIFIIRFQKGMRALYVNPKAETLTGYTRQELLSMDLTNLIHPDFRKSTHQRVQALLRGESIPARVESGILTKNGAARWLDLATKPMDWGDGEQAGVTVAFDITERKHAEEQLRISHTQLRTFAAYLQSVREQERTRIAREVHDELGQLLTAVKMDLSWLDSHLEPNQKHWRTKVGSALNLIETATQAIREIATELRPAVLDHLGLVAAIEWQTQQFQQRTGILCRAHLPKRNLSLSHEQATALFRIFQEALTNIARHANATQVDIQLRRNGNHLVLEVSDNGKGIRENDVTDITSLGLMGIRERAYLLGGEATMNGLPGKGTRITVRVPLHPEPSS